MEYLTFPKGKELDHFSVNYILEIKTTEPLKNNKEEMTFSMRPRKGLQK